MTTATHHLDIYEVELHLVTTKREWKKLSKALSFMDAAAPESLAQSHFTVFRSNRSIPPQPINVFWLDLQHHDTVATLIDSCAHEASHAAGAILAWTGHDIRGDRGIDEPHAYLVGWLTRWLWSHTHTLMSSG
jgi:hypothetical protein